MTMEEYNVKCALLRAACPLLEPHVLLYDTGWRLLGYVKDSDLEPIVAVSDKSFPRAESKYKEAYRRLVDGGLLKPLLVGRTTPHGAAKPKEAKS